MLQTFEDVNALLSPHGAIQSIMTDEERLYIWNCIKSVLPCAAIEIGSAYGGTTLLMAVAGAFPVWSVDNWVCGQQSAFVENVRPVENAVRMVEGDSTTVAERFADDAYGLVLVDGDHGEANGGDDSIPYQDIILYAPKVRIGGYLLIDDTENGHPAVTKAVERFCREQTEFELDAIYGSKLMGFRRCL